MAFRYCLHGLQSTPSVDLSVFYDRRTKIVSARNGHLSGKRWTERETGQNIRACINLQFKCQRLVLALSEWLFQYEYLIGRSLYD